MVQPVGWEVMDYSEFRTGLTFSEVRAELASEPRRWVTRRTVLGRMRQHKLSAYARYVRWMKP